MANQLYEQAAIFVSKVPLAEAQDVKLSHLTNAQKIHTMTKGFAGISPGSLESEITIKSAIPRAGIEFDYIGKLQNNVEVDCVLFRAGKKVKMKGFIVEASEAYSVDSPSAFDCTIWAAPVDESTL